MNYLRIYKQIMQRAKSEERIKDKEHYYENHHIVPDFMYLNRSRKGPVGHLDGNPNAKENLVLLTEREHILAHILLAKGLEGKRYWAQAASALTWFYTKVMGGHVRQKNRVAGAMRKYERYRKLGLAGISAARKGTMPVKDALTGKMQGSVSVNHPKVLTGEWVHHSSGKQWSAERHTTQPSGEGRKNHNARVLDKEYVMLKMKEFDSMVKQHFGGNFIAARFVEWFDKQKHSVVFYKFENSENKLEQKLTGLAKHFTNYAELAEETNKRFNLGWQIPKYGMGAKYNKVKYD